MSEIIVDILARVASATTTVADALWLRDWIVEQMTVLVARGEALGYENIEDDQAGIDAIAAVRL